MRLGNNYCKKCQYLPCQTVSVFSGEIPLPADRQMSKTVALLSLAQWPQIDKLG